jgi:16S rRNA G527 N7-methylase RsmG
MEPVHDIANIKRLTLVDLRTKRRQFRHEVKKSMNLKETDAVESVVSRTVTAQIFDSEDFEMQVDRWLSSADKVFLFIYFVKNPHINITNFIGEFIKGQDKP